MDAQTQNNREASALNEIEQRTMKYGDQVLLEKRPLTREQAEQWADQDIAALTRLQSSPRRLDEARGHVASNFSSYPDYMAAFAEKEPELATEIAEIAVENLLRIAAKEARKAADAAAMRDTNAFAAAGPQINPSSAPAVAVDQDALDRVANARARDAQAKESRALNSVERDAQLTRSAQQASSGNQLESDEIFTARQGDRRPAVPPEIEQQYLRVGDRFYHPKQPEVIAFEDKGNRLETKSNSEQVAETMVRIAEARGWDEIKVSGSEAFRKEVWLEASARGMHVKGYTPNEQDKIALARRQSAAQASRVDKDSARSTARASKPWEQTEIRTQTKPQNADRAEAFRKDSPADAVKKYPDLASTYAAEAAMEMKAHADGLTPQQRAVVMARVRENTANSLERGDLPPPVKVREEREVKNAAIREAKAELQQAR